MAGAVADEDGHVRPPPDQGEHAVAAGRVPDGTDTPGVDMRAEIGVAEEPIQNRAQLARAPTPILRCAAESLVAKVVPGMFGGGGDVAALGQTDRRVAVVQAAAAGPMRHHDEAVAPRTDRRFPTRCHGEGPDGRLSRWRVGRIPKCGDQPFAVHLDGNVAEAHPIGTGARDGNRNRKKKDGERRHESSPAHNCMTPY